MQVFQETQDSTRRESLADVLSSVGHNTEANKARNYSIVLTCSNVFLCKGTRLVEKTIETGRTIMNPIYRHFLRVFAKNNVLSRLSQDRIPDLGGDVIVVVLIRTPGNYC